MKKVLLIPFMLLCLMLFAVPGFAMKNEPKEFRGIPWGAPLPKNNLFGTNKWGLTHLLYNTYTRAYEEAPIGGAEITGPITYYFLDSLGFASVKAWFKGQENYDLVLKACIESWGKPDGEERTKNSVVDLLDSIWIGKRISVSLRYYFWSNESGMNETGRLQLSLNNYLDTAVEEIMLQRQKDRGL